MGGGGDSLGKTEGIKEVDESGSVGVGMGVKVKVEVSDLLGCYCILGGQEAVQQRENPHLSHTPLGHSHGADVSWGISRDANFLYFLLIE